jgi:hypothetical protein
MSDRPDPDQARIEDHEDRQRRRRQVAIVVGAFAAAVLVAVFTVWASRHGG